MKFQACSKCNCLTLQGSLGETGFVCDYCAKPSLVVTEKKVADLDYPTFISEFKKQWPTKAAFAKFYKLNPNTVQVALRPGRKTGVTKTQKKVYTVLIRRGFAKLMLLDEIMSVEEFILIATDM